MTASIFSPLVEKRQSAIHGVGLFAREALPKGTMVAIKGGHLFRGATRDRIAETLGPAEIQVADDLYLGPLHYEEREASMLHMNHSCDPNVGILGQIIFVTMWPVGPDEELTTDYAMMDNDNYELDCHCGSPACRGKITGLDWQRPDLQERYAGYFSAYLAEKIRAESA